MCYNSINDNVGEGRYSRTLIMNQELYQYFVVDRKHREQRKLCAENFACADLSPVERMTRRFEAVCSSEKPVIQPYEKIVLTRTVSQVSDCFSEEEWTMIRKQHYIHELGYVSNLSPDYESAIREGLLSKRRHADLHGKRCIDAIIGLCDKYQQEALRLGRKDIVEVFDRIPRYGARNFREALQFFRVLHFALWLEGDYHNTVGRFDQYMYPYFKTDMEQGIYTKETALELLEDFFISFNKDSDMYVGVQQGDNGQSMVLGGTDLEGNDCFNELSELCLLASRNLKLIDPKINLRVSENTPKEIYQLGTQLTRVGLGFPQYSNDDVVIPALIDLGYDKEDAVNYVVAACWEFIIPGVGNDIANIGAVNFPSVVDRAIRESITSLEFDTLLKNVKKEIKKACDDIREGVQDVWFVPSPFMDLLRADRKYNNFGIHGSGIACAADALAAVKKYVFDEKTIAPSDLIQALDSNFASDPALLHMLRFEAPKMGGENGELAVEMSRFLLDNFADALAGRKNCLGGIWRAGTGTAMYYLWHARELGATADGRRQGEAFGTNFSPSLFAEIKGPVSVIEAFTSQNISRTINGGPLTLEFASSVFNSDESIEKVAALIQYFISRGGHQLQLNAVNLDDLKKAQKDPEQYRQLVVRIWGWSAYFVDLDKEFQDHVMARQEYSV